MPVLALENTASASSVARNAALVGAELTSTATSVRTGLLRRNIAVAEVPDSRYWTAYDYYMIEREARAMRTAQLNALLGKGWRALSRLIFG